MKGNFKMNVEISKTAPAKQLVSGWANVAVKKDGSLPTEYDGDVIPISVLEEAAINFMINHRASGVDHAGDVQGTVVESIVFTKEKMESLGIPEGTLHEGWFITVKIHDEELFNQVREGKYKMFSIQGRAKQINI